MAVTPQSNATLASIAQALCEHDNYLIVGHVSPDGDCLGSQLSLMHALRQLGKSVQCVFASDEKSVSASLSFLPGIDAIIPAEKADFTPCVIAVDVPTHERMGEAAAALHQRASFTVTLDHHANKEAVSTLNYVDPQQASASCIVWELIGLLGVTRTREIATCAFTGLITDTGSFRYQNANALCFRYASEMMECGVDLPFVCSQIFQRRSLASLRLENTAISRMRLLLDGSLAMTYVTLDDFAQANAVKTDADIIVDTLRSIDGVRVACVLRQGDEAQIRGSLRSKDATDISLFAQAHNGGGHKAAAGMTLQGKVDQVFETIQAELCAYLQNAWKEC